ncbi:MAG: hypothetical protein JWL63_521 [Rhodocyclales bacterium]|nr:hypothetical protein [Rhodocyclales bacterium]
MKITPIYLTVAVWGDSFIELFLDYVLPSYLSPGGIPELTLRGYSATFWLYTRTFERSRIEEHPQYKRLAGFVRTELICIDELQDISGHQTPYETMNACHSNFMARAATAKAAMIFYSPDAFWSAESMRYTLDQVERGKRAVLMAGVRAEKEAVLHSIRSLAPRILERGLSSRELVDLLVQFPHKITRTLCWNAEQMDIGWASHLYWPLGSAGYLGRCFHLHTFFVHPRQEARPDVAHDFDWMDKIGLIEEEVCIVQDSDDMFALELSLADRGVNGHLGERNWRVLVDWVIRYAATDHRIYVQRPIYFRTGSRMSWEWLRAKVVSAIVVRCLLMLTALQEWRKR